MFKVTRMKEKEKQAKQSSSRRVKLM